MKLYIYIALFFIMQPYSLVTAGNKNIQNNDDTEIIGTFEYLGNRADTNHINIAVVNPNYKARKLGDLKTFLELYKKETKSYGWVILYETGYNITEMQMLIENNVNILKQHHLNYQSHEKRPVSLDLYGANINALNSSINRACSTSFIVENTSKTIILFTRPDMHLKDLCAAYPVILGINGLKILNKENMLYIKSLTSQ